MEKEFLMYRHFHIKKIRLILYLSVIAIVVMLLWAPCSGALAPKYVFLFVGDGMGITQRVAAGQFAGRPLLMDIFPSHGLTATSAANRFITDSAAAATALACGEKTNVGVLGLDRELKYIKTIAEMARDRGMKVGIVTTVSLDNATPAGFYAHVPSRNHYYDIALALAKSNFDYFAGGGLVDIENKRADIPGIQHVNALELARQNGYTIATSRDEFTSFAPRDGKLIAMPTRLVEREALPYSLDRLETDISLGELTRKGIELLEGDAGFFMMVEGGKIDWACHANDAATAVEEIIAFDEAIGQAHAFYEKHPQETLIVVTADHECGGMALGFIGTGYKTDFSLLGYQKISFQCFENQILKRVRSMEIPPSFEKILPLITSSFGLALEIDEEQLALSPLEMDTIKLAYGKSVNNINKRGAGIPHEKKVSSKRKGKKKRISGNDKDYLFYGREDPLTVTLTRILNHRAGIAWTTFSHTGVPVLTSAIGSGHEAFLGMYDNTDIGKKLMALMGMK